MISLHKTTGIDEILRPVAAPDTPSLTTVLPYNDESRLSLDDLIIFKASFDGKVLPVISYSPLTVCFLLITL